MAPKTRAKDAQNAENNEPVSDSDAPVDNNNDSSEAEEHDKNDKRDSAGIYNGVQVRIPTNKKELLSLLREYVKYAERARLRMLHLEEANEQLTAVNDQLAKDNAKFGKNDAEILKIKTAVDKQLFPFVKFITDKEQQSTHAKSVYKFILAATKGPSALAKLDMAHFQMWDNTYGDVLTIKVNDARGYSQERMRVAMMKFAKLHKFFPTVEEIWNCALRTINMNDQKQKDIFEFYCTDLFCKSTFFLVQSAHNFSAAFHFAFLYPHLFSRQGHR